MVVCIRRLFARQRFTRHSGYLLGILGLYVLLSGLYTTSTPPLEASDEAAHLGFALYVKDRHALPVADRRRRTLADQEATQAPLYYLVCAALIQSIDTSNAMEFYARRPDSPIGRADIPGPKHMFQGGGDRTFPYRRTMLAVAILRLVSVGFGMLTVWITYRVGRLVAPSAPSVGLVGSALIAFNPMFLFISNSVNNDNLVTLLVTVALFLVLRCRRQIHAVALGVTAGVVVLTKLSGAIVVPVMLFDLMSRKRPWRGRGLRLAVFVIGLAVTAGWWFGRNLRVYGELLALSEHAAMAGNDRYAIDLLALVREWDGFLKSYWGVFGAFNVVYPEWIYFGFFALTVVLLGSLAVWIRRVRPGWDSPVVPLAILAGSNLVAVVYWTSQLFGSQGRLMFPSIAALALLGAQGLHGWKGRVRRPLTVTILAFLLVTAAYAGAVVIPAAYE